MLRQQNSPALRLWVLLCNLRYCYQIGCTTQFFFPQQTTPFVDRCGVLKQDSEILLWQKANSDIPYCHSNAFKITRSVIITRFTTTSTMMTQILAHQVTAMKTWQTRSARVHPLVSRKSAGKRTISFHREPQNSFSTVLWIKVCIA